MCEPIALISWNAAFLSAARHPIKVQAGYHVSNGVLAMATGT